MGHSKLTSNKVANYKSTLLNKLKQSFFLRGQFKLDAALKLKLLLADLQTSVKQDNITATMMHTAATPSAPSRVLANQDILGMVLIAQVTYYLSYG